MGSGGARCGSRPTPITTDLGAQSVAQGQNEKVPEDLNSSLISKTVLQTEIYMPEDPSLSSGILTPGQQASPNFSFRGSIWTYTGLGWGRIHQGQRLGLGHLHIPNTQHQVP